MFFIVSCLFVTIPHAKRRQPPSRRSRSHFSIHNSLYTNKTYRSLSARRGGILVYSVYSVDSSLVSIRVHSWFKINVFQIFNVMLTVPMGGSLN